MTAPLTLVPRYLLLWFGAAVAVVLVWWHAGVLLPFVISLVVAYVMEPVVARLVRLRIPRSLAVIICLTLLLMVVSVLLVLLVPIVSQLVPMARTQLPDLLVSLWKGVVPTLQQLGLDVPSSVDEIKAELASMLQTHAADWGAALWASVLVGGSGLMTLVGLVMLVPMLAFYWLLDWQRLIALMTGLQPPRWRSHVHGLFSEIDALMGQYLRGQLVVMLILAVFYSMGLSFAGFRLALPIGVFTGLAVCIPYLGFGLGMLLALVAGLLQFGAAGVTYPLLAVAIVYGVGQIIESFVLTPRLVGERIGLHPLGVILALMLFGQWLGFWGVLIALPCAACLTVLGRHLLRHYRDSAFFRAP
jgi:predicted PurR-regulated permease PerM